MRGREVILAACGLAVAGLLVLLALEVGRPGQVEVDADALARARADHARLVAARQRAAPAEADQGGSDWSARSARVPAVELPPGAPEPAVEASSGVRASIGRLTRSFETRPPEPESAPEQPTIEVAMDETNALYDGADYEGALAAALEVLERDPGNVRMLRVVVSSGCITGDDVVAESHYQQLSARRDRLHMRVRCKRFGVDLPE